MLASTVITKVTLINLQIAPKSPKTQDLVCGQSKPVLSQIRVTISFIKTCYIPRALKGYFPEPCQQ